MRSLWKISTLSLTRKTSVSDFETLDATMAYSRLAMWCVDVTSHARKPSLRSVFQNAENFYKATAFHPRAKKIAPAILFLVTAFENHEDPTDTCHGIPRLDHIYICHLCGEVLRHQCSLPTNSKSSFYLVWYKIVWWANTRACCSWAQRCWNRRWHCTLI